MTMNVTVVMNSIKLAKVRQRLQNQSSNVSVRGALISARLRSKSKGFRIGKVMVDQKNHGPNGPLISYSDISLHLHI